MSADPDRIAAAHLLLDQLGVTLDDLHHAADTDSIDLTSSVPTLAGYLPRVIATAGPGANRTYGNYWRGMLAAWGDRRLDQITASDIEALQHAAAATATSRRNSRHGRHAGEHVIAAARAIYTRAIADNLIAPGASPAHRVTKPRRLPSTRRALTAHELDEINIAARTSGNDVFLDALTARLCAAVAQRLRREPAPAPHPLAVPADFGRTPTGTATTQAALGRTLLDLSRSAPDVAGRVVTLCPDVSSSTNLAGWVNKVGVWSPEERVDWFADDPETILHWRERPTGQGS
jgi:hypothetical protein